MAPKEVKLILDADGLSLQMEEISTLLNSLKALPNGVGDLLGDFISRFFHLPPDFLVCSYEPATTGAGDTVGRLCVSSHSIELLTATFAALKVAFESVAHEPPQLLSQIITNYQKTITQGKTNEN